MRKRQLLACAMPALLAGCGSLPPFYESHAGTQVASLRVLTLMQGSTFVTTAARLDCKKDPDGKRLGMFSPWLAGDWTGERAGLDHKLSLPGGEGLPHNMFSEWAIDADVPFIVHASAVIRGGGSGFVTGTTYVANNVEINNVAGFTPKAGHVYEIVYGIGPAKPELRLFEVQREEGGQVTRQSVPFDLGNQGC